MPPIQNMAPECKKVPFKYTIFSNYSCIGPVKLLTVYSENDSSEEIQHKWQQYFLKIHS